MDGHCCSREELVGHGTEHDDESGDEMRRVGSGAGGGFHGVDETTRNEYGRAAGVHQGIDYMYYIVHSMLHDNALVTTWRMVLKWRFKLL